ncbi:hypothetical protein BGZ76_010468 [Entomortierella beljakovae]|nr:hypothetical protein BGZ76_010468 [Entomortierella beljakovae]
MGVFGEKHTSLTREQKRLLIHQADTYKLRPTEVCDWVQATWGLRIARVTVYSILHKQRASLMAGHKDLYHAIQGGKSGNSTERVNKYRTSSKKTKSNDVNDPSSESNVVVEGNRWEGQLKRVREPASVELDRAMVKFLKSSEAIDVHGRRLNDAELQSHALRLAREIPSASRMRCSFGWLRHFKRRLGVQWSADRAGRYRWVIEMDPLAGPEDSTPLEDGQSLQPSERLGAGRRNSTHVISQSHRQGREHSDKNMSQSSISQQKVDELVDDDGDDDEYHSSHELLGNEKKSAARRSRSTSTSTSTSHSASYTPSLSTQARSSSDLSHHQNHPQQQHRHYSFNNSSLGHHIGLPTSAPSMANSPFLVNPPSIPSTSQPQSQSSILDSFPSLFNPISSMNNIPNSQLLLNDALSNTSTSIKLGPFGMTTGGGMRKVPSKDEAYDMLQSLLLYYEQDHHYLGEQQTFLLPRWIHQQRQIIQKAEVNNVNSDKSTWMRQGYPIPQINSQQTQTSPASSTSSSPSTPYASLYQPTSSQAQTYRSESTCSSPPLSPMSEVSPTVASTASFSLGSASANGIRGSSYGGYNNNGSAGLDHFNVSAAFPSLTSPIEQQLFYAHHHALQQQFAMQQQNQHTSPASPYSFQQ